MKKRIRIHKQNSTESDIFEIQFKKIWIKKFIIFFVGCLIIAGVWYGGLHTYLSSRMSETHGEIYSVFIAEMFMICLLIKLQLWRIITDHSFQGKIISIRRKETLVSPKGNSQTTATEPRYHIYLNVMLDSGKTIVKHIENDEPFYDYLWYHVGDQVLYHRGTKFPLVVGGRVICAYCGHEYIHDDARCTNCRHVSK